MATQPGGLATLFDDMIEGVQLIDREYRYRYLNPSAARQGQRQREDLLGQRMADMYPGIEQSEFFRLLQRCMLDREQQRMVNQFQFPDGSKGWFELRLTPVPEGVLIFSVDISDIRRAEDALRQMVGELEEAGRRKSALLTMLAHELRNPLAPIQNALHVLQARMPAGDPLTKRASEAAGRQLEHLRRIVDDLVDAQRLVTGKVTIAKERIDLGRVVRDAVLDHSTSFDEPGIELRVAVPETPVWVQGDSARLTQALGNILENARGFTARGGAVDVALRVTGVEVDLSVHDTGIGIDAKSLPHIFEPLYQSDTTLERTRGGLGIGLTTAKGIVELHGGRVSATSEPGVGTTIRILLPREAEAPAVTTTRVEAQPSGTRRRALVIEDNRDSAGTLAMILDLWGFQVEIAYDGPEGVAQAKHLRPDIVLCDIGLPGMDGYAVARTLRSHASTSGARMIAITGYGGDQDRELAMSAGFDLHLAKPVNPEVLRTQL